MRAAKEEKWAVDGGRWDGGCSGLADWGSCHFLTMPSACDTSCTSLSTFHCPPSTVHYPLPRLPRYHPGGRTPPSTWTRVQPARPLPVSTERCMSSVMKKICRLFLLVRVGHGVGLLNDVEDILAVLGGRLIEADLRGRPQGEEGPHRRFLDEHASASAAQVCCGGRNRPGLLSNGGRLLGIEHQVMGLVDFPMADGIDPDLGELPGLLAEEVAIDQLVDRRGDEEYRAQQQPGQGRGTSRPGPAGGRRSAAGPAPKGPRPPAARSQSSELNIASGESNPASSPATARELTAR